MRIVLPWPRKGLSPNDRVHHMILHRAKKAYRRDCGMAARAQGVKPTEAQEVLVHMEFHRPHNRAYDEDNLVASMKAGLDGLADALGVDDSKFRVTQAIAAALGGQVVVTIEVRA